MLNISFLCCADVTQHNYTQYKSMVISIINSAQHNNTKRRVFFIVMPSVIMLNAIVMSVMVPQASVFDEDCWFSFN